MFIRPAIAVFGHEGRVRRLAFAIAVASGFASTAACGGNSTSSPAAAFELDGAWTYLGPSDRPHDLTIAPGSMVFKDVEGQWSSSWTIKSYDNALHHFQLGFTSGTGTYLPAGTDQSATYDLSGSLLSIQMATGSASYPSLQGAGTCTSAADGKPLSDCRLYIKAN